MTRPHKAIADYFPHFCKHGRTMHVLEQRYGNDGFALWFKLLEQLASSENHFLDFKDPLTWEYFLSYANLNGETAKEILDLLATLDSIDADLWGARIVWSQNLVDNLASLYSRRKLDTPTKQDVIDLLKSRSRELSSTDIPVSGNNVDENPQSRVEESRVKESRVKETPSAKPAGGAPLFFSCQFFEIDKKYRDKLNREYSAIDDARLLKELSKLEDYIVDHPKRYSKKATGFLANPKNVIRNWLDNIIIKSGPPSNGGKEAPTADPYANLNAPDPNCPDCLGMGIASVMENGKEAGTICKCRRPGYQPAPPPAPPEIIPPDAECKKCTNGTIFVDGKPQICDCIKKKLPNLGRGHAESRPNC